MKKYREIKIKDPRLQKIRHEFRRIISLECKKIKKEIEYKKWAITRNPNNTLRKGITNEDWEEVGKLNSQYWALETPFRKSIILCNICRRLEGDRIFYPKTGEWYCPECYDKFYVHPEQFVPQG